MDKNVDESQRIDVLRLNSVTDNQQSLNICVNYWGQPRQLKIINDIYNNQIKDNINKFYICYSTWKNEDVDGFKKIFPDAYIIQYDLPDLSIYKDIIDNYKYDITSISQDISNYVLGLYIREKSLHTINNYTIMNNITFDIIITLRPDTDIYNGNLNEHYNFINSNINSNIVFVPDKPRYDIYNQGAVPDALLVSNIYNMNKILSFPKFENIAIYGNIIHPETATGKHILYNNFILKYLNIYAIRWQPIRY